MSFNFASKVNTQVGHVTDLMPTLLELAGASYQPKESGESYPKLVGHSLVPSFSGKSYQRAPIIWEHNGNRALLEGKWKLVAEGIKGNWELYDMEADRSETNNLAKQNPGVVKKNGRPLGQNRQRHPCLSTRRQRLGNEDQRSSGQ